MAYHQKKLEVSGLPHLDVEVLCQQLQKSRYLGKSQLFFTRWSLTLYISSFATVVVFYCLFVYRVLWRLGVSFFSLECRAGYDIEQVTVIAHVDESIVTLLCRCCAFTLNIIIYGFFLKILRDGHLCVIRHSAKCNFGTCKSYLSKHIEHSHTWTLG